ncbi:MAG: type IV secretory system conjugative DNA transfer family protein [Acidobacteria bacterium]|nr:type IV secretory system conjugative DNA transfer family protein [Acidobacteriota bacterium]
MTDWDWMWTTLSAPWMCWRFVHLISTLTWHSTVRVYRMRLPREITTEHIERWVSQLAAVLRTPRWWDIFPRWPIGVELVATEQGVHHLIVTPARLLTAVAATLAAAIPGTRLDKDPTPLHSPSRWVKAGEVRLRGTERLLAVDRAQETSRHLLATLQPLHPGEIIRVQWLIVGARTPRPPRDDQGVSVPSSQIIVHDQRHVGSMRWQQGDPVLSAVCRIGVATTSRRRARALLRRIHAALRGLDVSGAHITRRWLLPTVVVAARVTYRTIPLLRWPVTLTSREIAGLLGLATGSMMLPGVPGGVAPALPPSPIMPTTGQGLVIGRANYPGLDQLLCLEREDRLRHLWIAGPTGVGKSTLLANLIGYDIHRGDPVIVIDAGGDLVTDVLARIPQTRHEDVIVLDPTSTDRMIGFNPLRSQRPQEHELAAGLVFHVLHSIYASSWGPRTADILRTALLTLTMTHAPQGQDFTLGELAELLTNTGFRRFVITQPLTPALDSFWSWYEALPDPHRLQVISPALNKLRAFTLYTPLRLILGQSVGIDLTDAIHHKRIVLVPLKTGLLGAETAALIGSLIMATVWQATLTRARLPKDQRHPIWMYLDEFQNIVRLPVDLADMLAQARGFGLGLTLAHQHLGQLSPEIKAAVLGTTRSQLIFQVESHDATELAPRFAPLTREDLMSLGPHEIALRPCVDGITLAPVTATTYPLPKPLTNPATLAQASLHRYGLPRTEIEEQITGRTLVTPTLDKRSNRRNTGTTP